MSRLPSASPPYTTHLPSGDRLGNHSSPDCDVICVKAGFRSSRVPGCGPHVRQNRPASSAVDTAVTPAAVPPRRSRPISKSLPRSASAPADRPMASSSSRHASPMSRRRLPTSFSRHRRRRRRTGAGVAGREPPPVRFALEDRGHRVGHGFPIERLPAGQHLVEDAAKGPDVGALVDRPAARLLGAHVGRGAENDAVVSAAERDRG